MPHQCTNCGKTFPDGSKEMLSGCPECGGNKFQFRPASSLSDAGDAGDDASAPPSDFEDSSSARSSDSANGAETPDAAARTDDTAPAETGASAASSDPSGTGDAAAPTESDPSDADSTDPRAERTTSDVADSAADSASADAVGDRPDGDEDTAQASARRDVVNPDELTSAVEREARDQPPQDVNGQVVEPQSDDRPGLDELREELNEQFESIKIVNPGQYELNLMELYNRDEYIISLQEDGRYVIEVPDRWQDDPPDEA